MTRIREEKRDQLLEACAAGLGRPELFDQIVGPPKPVVGVIGDQSSDITIQVNTKVKVLIL